MDKIYLKNMMFYGFHGVHQYEKEYGQRLYIDAELGVDLKQAGKTDILTETIDYTVIYNRIKEIVENNKFNLLEALSEHIAETILGCEGVNTITVRIRKPAVPIPGQIDYVQVQITRGHQ